MQQEALNKQKKFEYIPWLDVVRLIAIIGVILCHSVDTFMVAPQARYNDGYDFWSEIYKALSRSCVPLFVMITGFLLLPIRTDGILFYKKRLSRILVPFLIWSVVYSFLPYLIHIISPHSDAIHLFFPYYENLSPSLGYVTQQVALIPLTFNSTTYPLWYIYMLIGLYLFIPVISTWLEKAKAKEIKIFIALWIVSLFIPYIRTLFNGYVFGEGAWNEFGLFYYFSGFIGYMVVAFCLKTNSVSIYRPRWYILLPIFVVAYIFTYKSYHDIMLRPDVTEKQMELFFMYCTPNIMLMTMAIFLGCERLKIKSDKICRFLKTISKYGFGIYLVHYLVLGPVDLLVSKLTCPLFMHVPLVTLIDFSVAWFVIYLLDHLPKSKWLIG